MKGMLLNPHGGLSLRSKPRRRIFHPSFVPEIARGYFWDVSAATGLGTAGFKIPEGNGNASFDFVQTGTTHQPTALAENGGAQFRMRKAADTNPSYLPDAAGVITGAGNLFVHTGTGQARILLRVTGGSVSASPFQDGTAGGTNTFGNPLAGAAWHWLEWFLFPNLAGASPNIARATMATDFVTNTPTNSASLAGFTTLFNGNSLLSMASRGAQSLANVDTTDFAAFYNGNGHPSLANRVQLANRNNPTGTLLAA